MEIVRKVTDLKNRIRRWKKNGYIIGFVPTMGALHDGHLSLIRQARRETDKVVISIFVNPIQFGPKEDLTKYPRPFQQDIKLCRSVGADLIFYPSVKRMYPDDFKTCIDMDDLPNVLCGRSRQGHFRGVMTVVTKLFNLVEPDIAYFGQKDYQQVLIIKQMVKDMDMNLIIKIMPTVREKDGLAMSSRNKYLTPVLRNKATCLSQALLKAKQQIKEGEHSSKRIISEMKGIIRYVKEARIDYIGIVNRHNLQGIKQVKTGETLIALAVFIDKIRLIDNTLI